ncbi:hypothetical protein QJQ45_010034 [Haematococcus lacustris]|nr:hypothetical protein QJQ45_010034 [Haematococcus lacustris]
MERQKTARTSATRTQDSVLCCESRSSKCQGKAEARECIAIALQHSTGHRPAAGQGRACGEHRTSRVSSALNGQQPRESRLSKRWATRPADWKPPAGQVEHRLLRPAWSQQRDQPVRGMMWSPVVASHKHPQAACSSQEATQPAASEPGPSTSLPAKRSKRTKRIGESRWRPLELCWWPKQGKLRAKGKEYPGLGYKRLRDRPPKAQEQQQPAVAQ